MSTHNRSVVDGNRRFLLFWPGGEHGKPATHTTIMKSLGTARGVRTSQRSWQVSSALRNRQNPFNAWNYVGWIYEIVGNDTGVSLKLVYDDGKFRHEFGAD